MNNDYAVLDKVIKQMVCSILVDLIKMHLILSKRYILLRSYNFHEFY